MALDQSELVANLAGLDALEAVLGKPPTRIARVWAAVWPKLAAVVLFFGLWQLLVWSGWKPEYSIPGPRRVLPRLWDLAGTGQFWKTISITMRRAVTGYAFAVAIGSAVGLAVAQIHVVRVAVGSMITGIQTMPSVVWLFPAVIVFHLSESAIFFVVVLGAAPSVATGLIYGVDHVPPLLLRAGHMLGARGIARYRFVVLPAVLPAFVGGLKQAWSFSWRSLMAGELLVIIANKPSIGFRFEAARTFSDVDSMYAWMIVIFVIGVLVDVFFTKADAALRRRWGLVDNATR
jgi:NitT/TauT family transport system permease protein